MSKFLVILSIKNDVVKTKAEHMSNKFNLSEDKLSSSVHCNTVSRLIYTLKTPGSNRGLFGR